MEINICIKIENISTSPLIRKWSVEHEATVIASGHSRATDACVEKAGEELAKLIASGVFNDLILE
jgi:hypothetical protein